MEKRNLMKCLFWIMIQITVLTGVAVSGYAAVPKQAVVYRGHSYYVYKDGATWKSAKKKCEKRGGHLVTFSSLAENKRVFKMVQKAGSNNAWIGLYNAGGRNSQKWRWVTGEKVSFRNWMSGQPDSSYGGEEQYGGFWGTAQWNDYTNDDYVVGGFYVCEWDTADGSDSDKEGNVTPSVQLGSPVTKDKKITVKYYDDNNFKYTCKYNDSMFVKSAEKDNKDLAMLSVLAAASTYQESNENNASRMLKDCGFVTDAGFRFSQTDAVNGHSKSDDYDHARVQLGYKTILSGSKTYLLVAVLINGYTKGKYEWISNFNVGTGTNHEGFYHAADEVKKLVKDHVKEYQSKAGTELPVKYWITGHSRGAAVANILAESLSLGRTDHVYAYGFATPRYTQKVKYNYPNIRNYINSADVVPMVAPQAWGYTRNSLYKDYRFSPDKQFKKVFRRLSKEIYVGCSEKKAKDNIQQLVNLVPTQKGYNKTQIIKILTKKYTYSWKEIVQEIVRTTMTGSKKDTSKTIQLIIDSVTGVNKAKAVLNTTMSYMIGDNHRMTAYIAGVSLL